MNRKTFKGFALLGVGLNKVLLKNYLTEAFYEGNVIKCLPSKTPRTHKVLYVPLPYDWICSISIKRSNLTLLNFGE